MKFGAVSQAIEAIRTFNGYIWDQHQLEVKFADQDAGPPSSGEQQSFATHARIAFITVQTYVALCHIQLFHCPLDVYAGSGGTPSDNLYIRVSSAFCAALFLARY